MAERRGRQNACVDRAITCVFCHDLHLTLMFSALLQKDLFKERWSLRQIFFKQNYCHTCHTRFAVLFDLLCCCISSLWNFCTHYSKVILQENQWWCREMFSVFQATIHQYFTIWSLQKQKLLLYKSLILQPYLTCCYLIWHFCIASDVRKVERVQEQALRIMYSTQ